MGNQTSTSPTGASRTVKTGLPTGPYSQELFAALKAEGTEGFVTARIGDLAKMVREEAEVPKEEEDNAELVNFLFQEENHYDAYDCSSEANQKSEEVSKNMEELVENPGQSIPNRSGISTEHKKKEKKPKAKRALRIYSAREVRTGKVIGEGGFGRMIRGTFPGGMPIAIKFFHAPLPLETLQGEVNALLNLKHKNLVEVFGIIEQLDPIDCPQVVLNFFPEGNILQYLSRKENPEDPATLGKLCLDIIEGLQYLKHKNIVHGNLAARNILIEKIVGRHKTYFNAKISDMGLIRFVEPTGGNYVKLPGTEKVIPLRWVPREIINENEDGSVGSDYTFASDVWSFGVMLWEIWTRGAIPYGASYSNMRVIQFLKDGYSPLKVHRPTECPGHVVNVMESIFKVNPNERPTVNRLYQEFYSFKGFGWENKVKGKPTQSGDTGASSETPEDKQDDQDGEDEELRHKLKKKKKEKIIKKKFSVQYEEPQKAEGAAANNSEASSPRPEPTPGYSGRNRGYNSNSPMDRYSEESTVAALLMRVNQLERDRERSQRGGYNYRRPWNPRGPRFNYHRPDDSPNTTVRQKISASGMPPSPTSQAPPPYTEEPLPHHSTTFPAPTSEYRYNTSEPPPPSRGRGQSRGGGRDDYLRKVRQLAEEIEVLRAEKMTQELLKKSAELASLMKTMTSGDSPLGEVENEDEPRYSQSRPAPPGPSRNYYQEYNYPRDEWHEQQEYMPHHQRNQPSTRRHYYGKRGGRGRGFGRRGDGPGPMG